jgi:HD-GYP domain-containing protein (c-di-GMP phosphodiesterase class II)
MSSLQKVELIGAYDAEKILDEAVRELRSETDHAYDQVDQGIQEDYEAGFLSILEDNEVTSQFDVTGDQAVVDRLRQAGIELVSKWEVAGLQLMHEANLAAIRQDWTEQDFRAELANILTKFQNQVDNIIRTEVNRAGNQGRLDASRYIAARYVQIYTQEDEQVCEQQLTIQALGPVAGCRDFWDGKHQNTVFRVSDAIGLLPLHCRCRCYVSPVQIPVR